MLKIGLTGPMGSGKTFVALEFAKLGAPILIMDEVVRELQTTNIDLIKKIETRFPKSYVDGKMDKQVMIKTLFYDETGKNLKDISDIIQPFLIKELNKFYAQYKHKQYVIVESALLYEYNLDNLFDKIIYVNSDRRLRKEVAMKRDGITSDEYDRRMRTQLPDELKIEKSDFIVNNDYSIITDQIININNKIK